MSDIETAFQDGCDTIVAGCTTYGSTPASNSPKDIVTSIKDIYTNRYNAGVNATKKGTATAAYVLSGYTFTNSSSVGISGTMTNLSSSSSITHTSSNGTKVLKASSLAKSTNSDGVGRLQLLYNGSSGYISKGTYIGLPYADAASAIGITSSIIKSGWTLLGVKGTCAAAATSLSGTAQLWVPAANSTANVLVNFSPAFASTPTVNFSVSSYRYSECNESNIYIYSRSASSVVFACNGYNAGYATITISWNAST